MDAKTIVEMIENLNPYDRKRVIREFIKSFGYDDDFQSEFSESDYFPELLDESFFSDLIKCEHGIEPYDNLINQIKAFKKEQPEHAIVSDLLDVLDFNLDDILSKIESLEYDIESGDYDSRFVSSELAELKGLISKSILKQSE